MVYSVYVKRLGVQGIDAHLIRKHVKEAHKNRRQEILRPPIRAAW